MIIQNTVIQIDKESLIRIAGVAYCRNETFRFKMTEVSTKLKAVIEANKKKKTEKLIDWSPHHVDFRRPRIPSLLDLSLNGLADNAHAISSLEHVPEFLIRRLTDLSCDKRTMNIHILKFLFKDSPTEISVKNCSWLSENQLVDALEKSNLQNLKVLQLENCHQFSFGEVMPTIMASSNSLAYLGTLSLKGAAKISNYTLWPLFLLAPLLHSINLSGCTFLTWEVVVMILYLYKTSLKELYLDDCPRIGFMLCVSALMKFAHLEVLSVARNRTVCDDFVILVTAACGKTLKELNLANCWSMTERSLQAISIFCPFLRSLNVSDVVNMSEIGMCYLADGCKSLESLYIDGNDLSDEVVAAFLETSGRSLKHVSLSKIGQVSFKTAFALTKYARKLETVDLSWCTKLTKEELGFIIDNSSSLKQLKICGCTKIAHDYWFKVTGSHMFTDTFEL